jgi:hypothetical protein
MAAFILDASVAISWCLPGDPTENTTYSPAILKRLATDDAVVPEIWAFEIANSILFPATSAAESVNRKFANTSTYGKPCPSGSKSLARHATSRLTTPPICIWLAARTNGRSTIRGGRLTLAVLDGRFGLSAQ